MVIGDWRESRHVIFCNSELCIHYVPDIFILQAFFQSMHVTSNLAREGSVNKIQTSSYIQCFQNKLSAITSYGNLSNCDAYFNSTEFPVSAKCCWNLACLCNDSPSEDPTSTLNPIENADISFLSPQIQ